MSAPAPIASSRFAGEAGHPAAVRSWAAIAVETDIARIEAEWRDLEAQALVTPYQAYDWVRPFVETTGAAQGMEFRYVLLRDAAGALLALLPFVITRRSGIRFAEFIGGKHANYHMGLYAPDFAAGLDAEAAASMFAEIGRAIGRLDALIFMNQPPEWQGIANPATLIAASPSPSRAYKLALVPGDGEATFRRAMSSHARKKLRNKRSRFADFGPSALIRARTPAEINGVIDAFLQQKAERFRTIGVADPFQEAGMRAFLAQAAAGDGAAAPAVELYALDLGGRCIATYVGAVQGKRFSGMATSFDMDSDTVRTSPGELLLADLIRLKCEEGFAVFDLGVGEARYKTTFCDDHDDLVDSFLPLTRKGRLFSRVAQTKRDLKRRIKSSPAALRLAHIVAGWLRRRKAVAEE